MGSREDEAGPGNAPPAPDGSADSPLTFAQDFPKDPRLDALVNAFREGNYRRVRELAPGVVQSADREEVRKAARELVRRTEADPLSIGLLVLTALLLFVLSAYWISRG
jgi:hypothetical protein